VRTLQSQERTTYKRPIRSISKSRTPSRGCVVEPSWRKKILEWMYNLAAKCDLISKEAIATAAYYLDTAIDAPDLIQSKRDFKILSVACLYLATKILDTSSVTLRELMKLCGDEFSAAEVLNVELPLIATLDWRLHPPTPYCFLNQYLELLPICPSSTEFNSIRYFAQRLIEAFICQEHPCQEFYPSEIACAASLLALESERMNVPVRIRHAWLLKMSIQCGLQSNNRRCCNALHRLLRLLSNEDPSKACFRVTTAQAVKEHMIAPKNSRRDSLLISTFQGKIILSPRSAILVSS